MRQILLTFMIIQIVAALFLSWHGFVAFFGLKKARPKPGPGYPRTRFAVVICANNEAAVIGSLLDALDRQVYPRKMFHISFWRIIARARQLISEENIHLSQFTRKTRGRRTAKVLSLTGAFLKFLKNIRTSSMHFSSSMRITCRSRIS